MRIFAEFCIFVSGWRVCGSDRLCFCCWQILKKVKLVGILRHTQLVQLLSSRQVQPAHSATQKGLNARHRVEHLNDNRPQGLIPVLVTVLYMVWDGIVYRITYMAVVRTAYQVINVTGEYELRRYMMVI